MHNQPGPFGNDADLLDRNGGGKSGVSDLRLLISLSWSVSAHMLRVIWGMCVCVCVCACVKVAGG